MASYGVQLLREAWSIIYKLPSIHSLFRDSDLDRGEDAALFPLRHLWNHKQLRNRE